MREDFWDVQRRHSLVSNLLVVMFVFLYLCFLLAPLCVILWVMGGVRLFYRALGMSFVISGIIIFLQLYFREVGISRYLAMINAGPPDIDDGYHKRLVNVVREISISSGIPMPDVVVVPMYSANAFTLVRRGKPVVGVTEGLLALLSREELQAVIAHEIAHIVNGCLLYTSPSPRD